MTTRADIDQSIVISPSESTGYRYTTSTTLQAENSMQQSEEIYDEKQVEGAAEVLKDNTSLEVRDTSNVVSQNTPDIHCDRMIISKKKNIEGNGDEFNLVRAKATPQESSDEPEVQSTGSDMGNEGAQCFSERKEEINDLVSADEDVAKNNKCCQEDENDTDTDSSCDGLERYRQQGAIPKRKYIPEKKMRVEENDPQCAGGSTTGSFFSQEDAHGDLDNNNDNPSSVILEPRTKEQQIEDIKFCLEMGRKYQEEHGGPALSKIFDSGIQRGNNRRGKRVRFKVDCFKGRRNASTVGSERVKNIQIDFHRKMKKADQTNICAHCVNVGQSTYDQQPGTCRYSGGISMRSNYKCNAQKGKILLRKKGVYGWGDRCMRKQVLSSVENVASWVLSPDGVQELYNPIADYNYVKRTNRRNRELLIRQGKGHLITPKTSPRYETKEPRVHFKEKSRNLHANQRETQSSKREPEARDQSVDGNCERNDGEKNIQQAKRVRRKNIAANGNGETVEEYVQYNEDSDEEFSGENNQDHNENNDETDGDVDDDDTDQSYEEKEESDEESEDEKNRPIIAGKLLRIYICLDEDHPKKGPNAGTCTVGIIQMFIRGSNIGVVSCDIGENDIVPEDKDAIRTELKPHFNEKLLEAKLSHAVKTGYEQIQEARKRKAGTSAGTSANTSANNDSEIINADAFVNDADDSIDTQEFTKLQTEIENDNMTRVLNASLDAQDNQMLPNFDCVRNENGRFSQGCSRLMTDSAAGQGCGRGVTGSAAGQGCSRVVMQSVVMDNSKLSHDNDDNSNEDDGEMHEKSQELFLSGRDTSERKAQWCDYVLVSDDELYCLNEFSQSDNESESKESDNETHESERDPNDDGRDSNEDVGGSNDDDGELNDEVREPNEGESDPNQGDKEPDDDGKEPNEDRELRDDDRESKEKEEESKGKDEESMKKVEELKERDVESTKTGEIDVETKKKSETEIDRETKEKDEDTNEKNEETSDKDGVSKEKEGLSKEIDKESKVKEGNSKEIDAESKEKEGNSKENGGESKKKGGVQKNKDGGDPNKTVEDLEKKSGELEYKDLKLKENVWETAENDDLSKKNEESKKSDAIVKKDMKEDRDMKGKEVDSEDEDLGFDETHWKCKKKGGETKIEESNENFKNLNESCADLNYDDKSKKIDNVSKGNKDSKRNEIEYKEKDGVPGLKHCEEVKEKYSNETGVLAKEKLIKSKGKNTNDGKQLKGDFRETETDNKGNVVTEIEGTVEIESGTDFQFSSENDAEDEIKAAQQKKDGDKSRKRKKRNQRGSTKKKKK